MQGIRHNIAICQKQFDNLKAKLFRWQNGEVKKGRRPTMKTLKDQVSKVTGKQYMKGLWKVEISEENVLCRPCMLSSTIDFHLSQHSLFDNLEAIRETQITYPAVGRFPAVSQTILHELTGIQDGLFHHLKLQRYCVSSISSSRKPSSRSVDRCPKS